MSWQKLARSSLAKFGFAVRRVPNGIGGNAFADMRTLIGHDHPVILDVGANIGQSVDIFLSHFSNAEIHSFEPSPAVYETLKKNTRERECVHTWNQALGSSKTQLELLENASPEWTSFLKPGRKGVGTVARRTMVPITTVDDFCRGQKITAIDILKSDTQGFDLEVLKGAAQMLKTGAIRLVYCELILSELYDGMPSFGDLYNFLINQGFALVSFYDINYENGLAGWTDGLFIYNAR
jgi:FkbM family methyltransferase